MAGVQFSLGAGVSLFMADQLWGTSTHQHLLPRSRMHGTVASTNHIYIHDRGRDQ